MTDPTPDRAPVAVPEAVKNAIIEVRRLSREYGESKLKTWGGAGDPDLFNAGKEAHWALQSAIATALREAIRQATETRDQEIIAANKRNAALLDQNFGLKAALDGWREAEAGCCPEDVGFVEYISTLQSKIARLTAELAAAQADTARLDWLEAFVNREPLLLHDGSAAFHGYSGLGLRPGALVRTLREAIDTARAAGEREG